MMLSFENKTIGSMATFPDRFDILRGVVESVVDQLDALVIYVNGTVDGIPDLSDLKNVYVIDGRSYSGDLSARGKVYPLKFMTDCRVFTLDDDFIYPPDYVVRNERILDLFKGRCVVTTHAGIFPQHVDWYYERTVTMPARSAVPSLQICSLAGSGTMCFDQKTLPLDLDELLVETMVDLQMSIAARTAGLPIMVVPRSENWLLPISKSGLWEKFRAGSLTPHTYLARQYDWSFRIYADILRSAMQQAGICANDIELDRELAECLISGATPARWSVSRTYFTKRKDYLSILKEIGA